MLSKVLSRHGNNKNKKILVYKNVNKKDRLFIRSWQTAVCGHCGVGKRWKREREMENREVVNWI